MDAPTKENTLYLPIKQIYFDEIVAGTKKAEYREIKDTTANRYLLSKDGALLYDESLASPDNSDLGYIDFYNDGVYPYLPKPYKYLSLAVGYAKERDTMLVEVTGTTFEPHHILGNQYAFWVIVYHLGNVVELHRK